LAGHCSSYLRLFCLIIVGILFALPVHAAVDSGSLEEKVSTSHVKVDLYGWTYSSAFSDFNGQTASAEGSGGGPIQLANQITAHTPAFGAFDFEITLPVVFQPFEGYRIQVGDPGVGVEGNWTWGRFNLWSRYDVLIPLSNTSREIGMLLGPRMDHMLQTRLARWLHSEVSWTTVLQLFGGSEWGTTVYLSPRLYYDFSDSFSLFVMMESNWQIARAESTLQLATPVSMGLGFRYSTLAGEGIWVQPFVNFYPSELLASNAHLGLFVGGPLF